jgi:hypothetical protein
MTLGADFDSSDSFQLADPPRSGWPCGNRAQGNYELVALGIVQYISQ